MGDVKESPDDVVVMSHPDIPDPGNGSHLGRSTRNAFEKVWAAKGWVIEHVESFFHQQTQEIVTAPPAEVAASGTTSGTIPDSPLATAPPPAAPASTATQEVGAGPTAEQTGAGSPGQPNPGTEGTASGAESTPTA